VAGEVTAGLAESNDSLPSGLWFRSPADLRTGISSRTLCSFRVRNYLYLYHIHSSSCSGPLTRGVDAGVTRRTSMLPQCWQIPATLLPHAETATARTQQPLHIDVVNSRNGRLCIPSHTHARTPI